MVILIRLDEADHIFVRKAVLNELLVAGSVNFLFTHLSLHINLHRDPLLPLHIQALSDYGLAALSKNLTRYDIALKEGLDADFLSGDFIVELLLINLFIILVFLLVTNIKIARDVPFLRQGAHFIQETAFTISKQLAKFSSLEVSLSSRVPVEASFVAGGCLDEDHLRIHW